jgi:hypothetical protein
VQSLIENEDAIELSKKVELITGLEAIALKSSEPLSVVEYVFGRYYGTHKDTV